MHQNNTYVPKLRIEKAILCLQIKIVSLILIVVPDHGQTGNYFGIQFGLWVLPKLSLFTFARAGPPVAVNPKREDNEIEIAGLLALFPV